MIAAVGRAQARKTARREAAGVLVERALPISEYPEIAPPTVSIRATYPGASAEVLAETVATPIEQEVSIAGGACGSLIGERQYRHMLGRRALTSQRGANLLQCAIEDGGLLAWEDLALVADLTNIEAIAQESGKRSTSERDATDCLSIG